MVNMGSDRTDGCSPFLIETPDGRKPWATGLKMVNSFDFFGIGPDFGAQKRCFKNQKRRFKRLKCRFCFA